MRLQGVGWWSAMELHSLSMVSACSSAEQGVESKRLMERVKSVWGSSTSSHHEHGQGGDHANKHEGHAAAASCVRSAMTGSILKSAKELTIPPQKYN